MVYLEGTKEIYHQLTGVNLDNQIDKWNERAKGYYGEYKILNNILYGLKGNFKVLMNIIIPINNRQTEIDIIIIHEVGIFVIEAKYYKGKIYGDSDGQRWTQYFRSARNNTFINPIKQNDYHIRALRQYVEDLPLYSFIVFVNNECELKIINNRNDVFVTYLEGYPSNLSYCLELTINNNKSVLSLEEIDNIFNKLKKYSNITEGKEIFIWHEYLDFNDFIINIKNGYENRINKINYDFSKMEKNLQTYL